MRRKRIILDVQEVVENIWSDLTDVYFTFDYKQLGKKFSKEKIEDMVTKRLMYTIFAASKEPAKPMGYAGYPFVEKEYGEYLGVKASDFAEAVSATMGYQDLITVVHEAVFDLPYSEWLLQEVCGGIWVLEDTGDIRIKEWEELNLDENGNYKKRKRR